MQAAGPVNGHGELVDVFEDTRKIRESLELLSGLGIFLLVDIMVNGHCIEVRLLYRPDACDRGLFEKTHPSNLSEEYSALVREIGRNHATKAYMHSFFMRWFFPRICLQPDEENCAFALGEKHSTDKGPCEVDFRNLQYAISATHRAMPFNRRNKQEDLFMFMTKLQDANKQKIKHFHYLIQTCCGFDPEFFFNVHKRDLKMVRKAAMQARFLALCMGLHERLGADSKVMMLDENLLKMITDSVTMEPADLLDVI